MYGRTVGKPIVAGFVIAIIAMIALLPAIAQADVFNMPAGQTSLQFVTVGNPGNVADSAYDSGLGTSTSPGTGAGAVPYTYNIGKYDVTFGQYCQFLNSVATKSDPYNLFAAQSLPTEGIGQTGNPGNYSYSVTGSNPQAANCPIVGVTWGDAARFCNWLQNGQPTGLEGPGTTETGAYALNGDMTVLTETRSTGARYAIPSDSEWYKAAYYDPTLNAGTGGYWTYATRSNTMPDNSLALAASESNDANGYHFGYTDPMNYLTPVGLFARSSDFYGTFDQSGDVWNWDDAVTSGSSRGLRGGSWGTGVAPSSFQYQYGPSGGASDIGFRVEIVPEPGSAALLTACGLCLLGYRWRRSRLLRTHHA
jgi:formylglycine-generating enzyme